jgi:hypothetical protein
MAVSQAVKVRNDIEVRPTGSNSPMVSLEDQDKVKAYISEVARIAAGDIRSESRPTGKNFTESLAGNIS